MTIRLRAGRRPITLTRSVRTPGPGAPVGIAARSLPRTLPAADRRRAALRIAGAAAARLNRTRRAADGAATPWALPEGLRWRAVPDRGRALILPLRDGERFLALGHGTARARACRTAGGAVAEATRFGLRFAVARRIPAAAARACR